MSQPTTKLIALFQFYPDKPLVEASWQECSPTIVQQSTPTHAQTSLPHLSSNSSLYPHSFSTYSSTTSILADSGYGSLATSCSSEQLKSGMKKHSSQMSFGSAAGSRQVSCGNLPLDDFPPSTLAEDSIAEDEDETSFEDTGAQEEELQDTSFRECTEATEVSTESEHPCESKRIADTAPPHLQELMNDWKEEMKEEMKEYCTQILQEKLDNMKLESSSASSFSEPSAGKAPTMECKTCTGSPHSSKCPDALTSSHSCPLLEEKGVQTPENLRRLPSRLHSDSEFMKRVMLRRKPKLSDLQKAHSASDAVSS